MRILFVTPYLATPPHFGAQRRLDGLMRGLAANHEVSLLSYKSGTAHTEDAARAYCRRVETLDHDVISVARSKKRALQAASLFSPQSFESLLYTSREFQARFERMLAQDNYDVVQVEFAQMAVCIRPGTSARRPRFVLDEHNIEYDLVKRTAESDTGLVRRAYSALNWRKVRHEEVEAWRRFDGVALTSVRDQEILERDLPGTRSVVVPNGVDLDNFRPSTATPEPLSFVFLGAMNYFPNIEAIQDFVANTWPKILAQEPRAKFVCVGQSPPDSIQALRSESVEITGFVDDPRKLVERASVVVVPLRIGGGTRFKIVEALAMGKAIVSTRLGAEGLDVTHEKNLLLADEASDFANQAVRVARDPALREMLGKNARQLAEDKYGWPAVVRDLERFYDVLSGAPVAEGTAA